MSEPILTLEQEAEAVRLAEIITKRVKEEVLVMARIMVSKQDHELLGRTEFEIRDRVHKLGADVVETAVSLTCGKMGYHGACLTCPGYGGGARFVGYWPNTLRAMLGDVHLERGHYHFSECGQGFFPFRRRIRHLIAKNFR